MKTWVTSKLAAFAAMIVGIYAFSPFQAAAVTPYTLPPGTTVPALPSTYPMGGVILNSEAIPFSSGTLAGSLFSEVIQNDSSNPYGGLTFTYQLAISAGSPDSASQVTVSSFTGFFTDVSYSSGGAAVALGSSLEVAPSYFSRSSSGNVVRFNFLNQQVLPGETSTLLVIQTDAAAYQPTQAAIIDSLSVNVASFAPLAVPEPGTVALLFTGIGMVALALRRRK